MKRTLIYFSIIILSISVFNSCQNKVDESKNAAELKNEGDAIFPQSDVRNVRWGMSKQEVMNTESKLGKPEYQTEINLGYRSTVLNKDASILYEFRNNKLFSLYYEFKIKHTNKNDYIDDYNDVKTALIEKYGRPSEDKIVWKNDLYRDDVQHFGMAVSLGHLVYKANWQVNNNRTDVSTRLYGDNYKIYLFILYASIQHLHENPNDNQNDGL
jgi:hypothetical protein